MPPVDVAARARRPRPPGPGRAVGVVLVLVPLAWWLAACTSTPTSRHAGTAAGVDWRQVRFPVDCSSRFHEPAVLETSGEAGPGHQLLVAVVACGAVDGSAPAWVFAYHRSGGGAEGLRLDQVLLTASEGWVLSGTRHPLRTGTASVDLSVVGYRGGAPRCCPNVTATLTWHWSRILRRFVATGSPPPHNPAGGFASISS